jgi:GNAT superfamily N-acetyltransferase
MLRLRPARLDEAAMLGELCLRSKAVWGYDAAFLETCRAELRPGEAAIADERVHVGELDGAVVGVAEISVEQETAHLEKLFVEPSCIGRGVGARLMDWAVAAAAERGARRMVIEADPGAAEFYLRRGAREDGFAPSGSIPGRMLPRLVMAVG